MANHIPRFEFNDISIVGDTTNLSPVITDVVSTSEVFEGMIIDSANFPVDSYVISKTVDTVTISAPATADTSAGTLDLFERVDFQYPSTKLARPTYVPTEQISESIGGNRQIQINNMIKKVDLKFEFMTPEFTDLLEARWYLTWALYGKAFRYFESKDETPFENYELEILDWKPVRSFPKSGNFLHSIQLKFRRVVAL